MKHNKLGYKILTPEGYQKFKGIRQVHKDFWYRIILNDGTVIGTSDNHKFETEDYRLVEVKDMTSGQVLSSGKYIISIERIDIPVDLYDVMGVDGGHLYMTSGVVSRNCDAEFLTSGDTVFDVDDMAYYEETECIDPVERRGVDGNLWIWEYPDYTRSYMVSADVARGDGSDYSAFHVWDIEACAQVAEYKGQLRPKDFGAVLVSIATEYNNALLVPENANIGWSTIEEILSRGYGNLYYGDGDTMDTAESYARKYETNKLTPGFTTSLKTRPLIIARLYDYIHQKQVILRSKRLLSECRTFIWKNNKAQASAGLNDDLVLAAGIGLFVRDHALKLRQQGLELNRAQLNSFGNLNRRDPGMYSSNEPVNNPYKMQDNFGNSQDITWLL